MYRRECEIKERQKATLDEMIDSLHYRAMFVDDRYDSVAHDDEIHIQTMQRYTRRFVFLYVHVIKPSRS